MTNLRKRVLSVVQSSKLGAAVGDGESAGRLVGEAGFDIRVAPVLILPGYPAAAHRHASGRQHKHGVAVAVETVTGGVRMAVGGEYRRGAAEGAYQHQQSRAGQMEISQQRAHGPEAIAGIYKDNGLALERRQSAPLSRR